MKALALLVIALVFVGEAANADDGSCVMFAVAGLVIGMVAVCEMARRTR